MVTLFSYGIIGIVAFLLIGTKDWFLDELKEVDKTYNKEPHSKLSRR
jgi:hypothetical protein